MGSVINLTNSFGQVVQSYQYEAFGNIISTTGSIDNSHKFSTKEHSSVSGLVYLGARYYDPKVGRFITKEPLAGQVSLPLTLNRYTYCLNNPVNLKDPFGMRTYFGLTGAEWRMSIRHPGASMKVNRARHKAEQSTLQEYGKQGHNDEADAYRHAYWSAEMTKDIGSELAEAFGIAHEQNRDQLTTERDMDLHNNKVGRQMASDPANKNKSTKKIVKKALKEGKLQTGLGKPTK